MLQHEFEDLIGRKVEREEYIKANALYMSTDLDKEDFCKEWDCIKDSLVIQELGNALARMTRKYEIAKAAKDGAAHLILDALHGEQAEVDYYDKRYVNAARLLIGEKAVTKYRIEHDYALDEHDRTLIKELLG